MEENKGVLENEGKNGVSVMIPPSTDVEAGSISRTTKLGSSSNLNIESTGTKSATEAPQEDDDEDTKRKAFNDRHRRLERKKVAWKFMEGIFVCLVGFLAASLTVPKLKDTLIWGSELWKWTVLVLAIFCGGLISKLLIATPLIIIGGVSTREVILYLVRKLNRCVQHFIWLGLILLGWVLLINRGVKRSRDTTRIMDHVTNALVGCLAGAAIWFVKSFLIGLLAFSFQRRGRLHDQYFVQKVIWTLSGPPQEEERLKLRRNLEVNIAETGGQDATNAWERRGKNLVKWLTKFALWLSAMIFFTPLVIHFLLDVLVEVEEEDMVDAEEEDMVDAEAAPDNILSNVAKPNREHVDEEDFRRFMKKRDVDRLLPLLPGAKENKKIEKPLLKKWLVESCKENGEFTRSLNYTRRALEKLDRIASGVAVVICIIVWCLIMGTLTTNVLILISSQIVLAAFMFGNTAKTMFEAIIFVFIMHPFDVGDQCVIDEEQMLVEEIKILHTIFSRDDRQKVFYPNSVLLTKPIRNSYRKPEMDDSVEFNIDLSTSAETIDLLKARIRGYLNNNLAHWFPEHSLVVKDIDNTGNLKMSLSVTHNIGFHSSGEKSNRRSDLILELMRILEQLEIKYRLLPQEVHVKYI